MENHTMDDKELTNIVNSIANSDFGKKYITELFVKNDMLFNDFYEIFFSAKADVEGCASFCNNIGEIISADNISIANINENPSTDVIRLWSKEDGFLASDILKKTCRVTDKIRQIAATIMDSAFGRKHITALYIKREVPAFIESYEMYCEKAVDTPQKEFEQFYTHIDEIVENRNVTLQPLANKGDDTEVVKLWEK